MSKTRSRSGTTTPSGGAIRSKGEASGVVKRLDDFLHKAVLPESEFPSGTNYRDRQLRLKAVQNFNKAQERAFEVFDGIEEGLEAEKADREENRNSGDEDRRKRRESDERARDYEEARKDIRLFLEVEERQTARRDLSLARNMLVVLTAICVLATITLAFVTVLQEEPLYFGGSGFTFLLSGAGVYLLRSMRWGHGDVQGGDVELHVTEPFAWSGLEFESRMLEEQG